MTKSLTTTIIRRTDLQEVIHAERLKKELYAKEFLDLLIEINLNSNGHLKSTKGGVAA